MHGLSAQLTEIGALARAHAEPAVDILICPPATLIERAAQTAKGSAIRIGGQDCHGANSGAHTGDVSAAMLADAGASHVILGHSERRADHEETNEQVRAKARVAIKAGLTAIVCVGESLSHREAGKTLGVVSGQLAGSIPDGASADTLVIAYEPVWAIGTGRTASPAEIAEVHAHIRNLLAQRFGDGPAQAMRILYGGSVKPDNAGEIFAVPDVDGALVGGASLKAADFSLIVSALEAS